MPGLPRARKPASHRAAPLRLLGLLLVLSLPPAAAEELILFNWPDYLADDLVQEFTKATGHTIKIVHYDNDNQRDEVLASASGQLFDLVVIDSTMTQLFGAKNYLKSLPWEDFANTRHIAPRWRDSCHGYGIPYFWGTVGIAWRSDKLAQAPSSWRDLLEPAEPLRGHIGMLKDVNDTFIPPLKLAGHSIFTAEREHLKAAYEALLRQKPHVLTYKYPPSFLADDPRRDQLYMAMAYSGDHLIMNGEQENGPWHYAIPSEGTSLWVDCIAIVNSSKKAAAAAAFIDFLHSPKMAAINANTMGAATVNASALPAVKAELRDNKTLYPPESVVADSELYQLLDNDNLRQRNRILEHMITP